MSFTSLQFLLFTGITALVYQFCPVRFRVWLLLIASYAFYATWSVKAALALAAATLVAFLAGRWIRAGESPHRAKVTAASVVCLLTLYLAFFKIAAIVPGPSRLIMPLGVSYYTFKLISYVMDVYWGTLEPEKRLVPFAAYVAFFPQIVAGPIQRPGDFLAQTPAPQPSILRGVCRMAWGFAKKVLVGNNLSLAVDYVFNHVKGLHGPGLLTGFYLFPLYLYVDFSSLTDIAIGTGLLFGIEGPENFNRPFTASSISEYWRRWHMSLTNWLADYVFTPLRMATRSAGKIGLAFSITVNMVAIGIWHGVAWGFLVFGLIHSVALVIDALTIRQRARFFKRHPRLDAWGSAFGVFVTFHVVALTLVFFRAQTVSDAMWLLGHMMSGLGSFAADLARLADIAGAQSFAAGLAGLVLIELAERYRPDRWWVRFEAGSPWWVQRMAATTVAVLLMAAIFVLAVRGGREATPFLYQVF